MIVNKIQFPRFTGVKCNMMPFIQGDARSLPEEFKPYADIINSNYLEKGKIGFLTIDEAFVEAGKSQRGYNNAGINRNVHVEVGRKDEVYCWGGGGSWGGKPNTLLNDDTMVLVANSVSDTCRVWNTKEFDYTKDGDLSEYIDRYPENTGQLLKAGEVAKISIFTPHECVAQKQSGNRQFFRIVGSGVKGREPYFTVNPMIEETSF
jgi:hypothetical protein